jgi:hypothetical protein
LDSDLLRLYSTDELGPDGYPPEWHATIKHAVRAQALNRCVRCWHPYENGKHGNGEWSECDVYCTHGEPRRYRSADEQTEIHGQLVRVTRGWYEAQWRILTVHHLDGNKANCRWWNLISLCQRCHLTIQGRVVLERAFIFEHSKWFKPYASGWYSHKYLGEEISREEALARQDELLGLERLA